MQTEGGETDNQGYQSYVDAESTDDYVRLQTTKNTIKFKADIENLAMSERTINRFIMNGEKNRFLNVPTYDEILDMEDMDFYYNASTLKTPYGNYILSQAPTASTLADFYHLIWLYNVRTIVCLVDPSKLATYFNPEIGHSTSVFMKYEMQTLKVSDVKNEIKVYQLRFTNKSNSVPKHVSRRIIYVVYAPTELNGVRDMTKTFTAMEEMWALDQAYEVSGIQPGGTLVHGLSGTRRTSYFVASALLCKQVLETGRFSAMDVWVEIRKRRSGAASRKQDFFSSIHAVIEYSKQIGVISAGDPQYSESVKALIAAIEKDTIYYKQLELAYNDN